MGYFILVFFILTFDALGAQEIEQFVCDETGRFENPTDDTCRTFYLCSFTREGDLVQTQYSCPDGTYFSPTNGICSRNFTCQRSSVGYVIDTEKGDNVHYHCQDETQYKFKCTRSGRFVNLLDPNCKKYHLCSLTQNGFYVETELQCPDGTLFDPNTQKCHTKYQCPCDFIDWETSKGKIFFSKQQFQKEWHHFKVAEFSCTSTDYKKEFECQEAGVFADERDVTCTDYFMCSQLSNGKYVQSFFSCPHGSAFDPFAKRCSSRYECSCQIETSTIPSNPNKLTTSYTELIPSPQSCFTPKKPFACKKRGRFPNRRDVSCSTYYLCDLSRRGELKSKLYRCPRCLYFNPKLGKCTDDYICPCNAIEGSGQSTTNPTNSRSTRSVDTTTRHVTRITTDCRMPSPSRPFRCTSKGRFPDRRDTTCSSYFLCTSLKRNIFKRSSYKCMRNLKFDPSTQRCSASYECPCTNISMTSSLNMSTISLPTTKRSTISSEPTSSSHSSTSFSTATTDDCTVPAIDRPFRCRARGRFPDRRDVTCVSYFLCATDRRGILRRTSVRCQRNTRFDPTVRRCSARYVCPCIRTSITATQSLPTTQSSTISSEPITSTTSLNTTTRATTETGPIINTGTTATSRTTVTTKSPTISTSSNISTSTQISNTTTSFSTSTTDDCTVPPIDRPFRCRARGRFADRRDVTCVSYFLCATDRRGILRRTSVRCQRNTRFDPTVRRCSARYVCPCIRTSITATQNMTTMSLPTTQRSTISSEPITSNTSLNTTTRATTETEPSINTGTTATSRTTVTTESPTISTSSNISTSTRIANTSTSSSTVTTDDCAVPPFDRPFRCTARGRFPDRRDVTCVSYFLCSTDWQGILRRTSVRCLRNTRFNPTLQRCSARYVCPCIRTSITATQNMTTMSLPTTQRSTISSEPITSTISLNTTTRATTETEPSINTGTTATSRTTLTTESPTVSTPSNISTSTQISSTTTSSSTATTDDCTVPPIDRPFRCRERGRFPDRRDVTCVSYFLCATDWQGNLRRTSVRCQRNTRFDPTIQRCSTGYVCPCIGTSIRTTQNMTTVSLPSTQRSTISSEPITSTTSTNTTTRQTTETIPSINTGTTATSRSTTSITQSPTISTPFNVSSSTQISNTTTSFSTTTSVDCIVHSSDRPFRCTSIGIFPNRRDTTCSTYFQCYLVRTGSFRRHFHQCQRNLKFDPSLRKCSDRYVCPCESTTVNMTTFSSPSSQSSTISSEPTTSSTNLNTTTSQTTVTVSSTNTRPTVTSRTTTVSTQSSSTSTSSNASISTQTSNTTTSFLTGTTDDCTVPPIDRPFRCTARGRFPDRRDVTCVSYFLCATDWRGILRRTSVRCQSNTRFDPTIRRCSARYACPCIRTSITATQNMTTMSLPTTQRSTISSEPITSTISLNTTTRATTETEPSINTGTTATSRTTLTTESPTVSTPSNISTSTQISSTTTSSSTATTDDCTVPPIDRPFRCRERGRFPDRRDVTCVSYFLCATDWQGNLRRTSVRCQRNTRFDPTIQRCSTGYVCPCIGTSIRTTQNMTTVSLPSTQRSTISSEPITSTTSTNTTTRQTTETIPSINTGTTATSRSTSSITQSPTISTPFNVSSSTQISNTTTSFSTTKSVDCIVHSSDRPFRCTSIGIFPNRRDTTCSTYFQCYLVRTGSFRRHFHQCQRNLKFDPSLRKCTDIYVCPCESTTVNMTTFSSPSSQSSTISSEPTTSSTNLNTTTSQTTVTVSSTDTRPTVTSRTTTVSTQSSSTSTSSNASISTQTSNTTTSFLTGTTDDCTVPPIDRPFRCTARGRFPDRRDVTCVSYFLCATDWRGILRRTSVRCQRNTRFDPTVRRCSARYVCPCIRTSITATQNMTTMSLPTTQRSTISSEPITSTISLNTTTRATTETEPSINTGTTATSRTTVTTESPTVSTSSNISTSTQISSTTTSSSTATTDDCTVPPIDRPFRCRARGRFPDRRDVTCVSYFLCATDRRGILRRTSVRCQRNTRFDPTIQRCSTGYVCPCIGTSIRTTQNMTTVSLTSTQRSTISSEPITSTTSTNTTTRQTTETIPSINTGTTATSRSTTSITQSPTISTPFNVSISTQISNTTTSFSTATTDDCTVPPIDRPFRCRERGRFPDRRDVTCISYFLCSTDWQGILRRTSVRCQRNTRFNPTVQRCSSRYVCPCIRTSITATQSLPTTQSSTISSEPITSTTSLNTTTRATTETGPSINTGTTATSRTTETTESPTISTSSNISTSTQISNTTTSFSTSTTDDCTVLPIDRPFRCRARGRFPDRRDVTCVSYFLCATDWQGILRRTSVRCQRNTRFDPTIQRCSTVYVCPCIGTSIRTTQNMTTVSLPSTQRSTISSEPITSTTSTNTTTRQTTETIPSINTGTTDTSRSTTSITPSPTISTPFNVSSSTQISNTTTSFSTTTSVDCIVHSSDRPFRCTSIGIFPNRRDTTCSTYFQCYLVRIGSFRRHFHQCQRNLKFDPSLRKCSDRYVCPCESTTVNMTTFSSPSSQPSTISSEPTTSSTNLNTTTSQTTVTVSSTNTRPTVTSRTTTVSTQSSSTSTSSNASISTQTSNTTTSFLTGTTDDCTVPPIDRPFRCTARGRFPDRRDVTCVSYFLCATDWRGILRRTSVRCQSNTRFDPTIRRCSARYVCPCIRTSITATQNMTTMSLPTTQRSTISSEPITSTISLNTTTRATTETEPSINTGTTATSRTTVTTESPTVSTFSNISTSTQITSTTTSSSTATTDDCTVPPIDRPFRCRERGRFPDRRDVTCLSYFLCSTDWQGILRRTSVRCQRNTRFDPTIQRCSIGYVCPCIGTSIRTTQNMTTVSLPSTQRSTISSEPITSTTSTNTTTRQTTETIPSINTGTTATSRSTSSRTQSPTISTPFNVSSSTQISNTTTSFSTTTSVDCIVHSSDRPFRCTSIGIFPNRRDTTCSTYFQCYLVRTGSFRRHFHQCQRNLKFDPSLRKCSDIYVCPCESTTVNMTTFSSPSSQSSTISSEPTTSSTNLNTTTSQTAVTVSSTNTRPTVTSRTTTVSTQSSSTSTSSNASISTQTSNTTTSFLTGTTDDCTVPPIDRPFRCTARGRFPDRRDVTCVSYFLCATDWRGILRRTSVRCQRNTRFDPTVRRCSARYVCPCIRTSITATQNMTTMSLPTTQRSTISSEPITSTISLSTTTRATTETEPSINTGTTATSRTTVTTESPTVSTSSNISTSTQISSTTTSSSTATTDDCTVPPIDRPFRCTARGRFPDRRDVTCVSYFLCATDWRGILRRTSVRCQRNTRFDPTVRRCSARYVCPCIRTSITATQNMTTMSLPTTQRSTISSEPITSTISLSTTTRATTETEPSINTGTTATSRTTVTTESPTVSTSSNISTSTQISSTTTSSSTATTDDCTVPPFDRPFRCTARGRFPDRRDVTCVSYFLCATDWQGILRRTSVRCQRNTRFDPMIQRCSTGYVCPCIGTSIRTTQNMTTVSLPSTQRSTISSQPITSSTSTNTTTRQTTETISSINTGTTATSRSTTSITQSPTISTPFNVSSSTQISNTTTRFSTTTSVDCIVHSSDRPFRCTSIGIFPNRRDTTCSTYFQCYLVRTGSFRRHFHQCQRNLKFDPSLRKCSDRYVCPCESTTVNMTTFSSPSSQPSTISSEPTISSTNLNTTTSQTTVTVSSTNTRPTATSRTTTAATTTQSPTISTSSNVSMSTQTSNTTTSFSTGTTADCTVPPIDRPFRCTSSGRFPDRRDVTCVSYFSCTMDWQGILRRTSFRCQRNTRFDPSNQRCSARYVCPCTHASTTLNLTTLSLPTTDASTRTSHTTTLLPMTETTRYPSSEIISSTRSTTNMCIVPSPDYKFNCESEGRFPDIADQRCFSYFLCSYVGGRYVQSQFRCPPGSKFDPYVGKCSFVYDCPCDSTGGTTSSSLSTVEACSITTERFICTETGHFKNPTDLSCCTYYLCSASQNGTIIQREYSCPEGYKFDPDSRQCTEDYTCPCSVTEPIENFTPPSFECDIPTEEFVCTSVGRFPNRQDVSCCNYILCSISETGSFVKFEYSCPEGTTFDPELQRCSEFYQCPCINTEVSENKL
ncbi:hypothetical protein WA026_009753 [Henosepilachna vigintioctopunctata]|uniref:Chitin-binding type-2 domain-containing protein n=1 Tax=Henosepilachna vigintioctopunctata TaxID=420089 RepID=A0AAW1TQ79_9CUCU